MSQWSDREEQYADLSVEAVSGRRGYTELGPSHSMNFFPLGAPTS